MYRTCPKCGHESTASDTSPVADCPACGVIFAKWMSQRFRRDDLVDRSPSMTQGWAPWLRERLFYVEPRVNIVEFWARAVAWAGFALWSAWFLQTDYAKVIGGLPEINYSFMHRVDLVFHEAGHVVFMPLGRFMSVLGGSLGQLIMPAIVFGAFLFKHRNPFGASIALWWFAQSALDLAPYINDALVQQTILLGGVTGRDRPGYHDWNNILGDLGLLNHAHGIAGFVDLMAEGLIILALVWGAYLLSQQRGNLEQRF